MKVCFSLSDFVLKFDQLTLKHKTATRRRKMTNGLNSVIAIENRDSLTFLSEDPVYCYLSHDCFVKGKGSCDVLFLNV